MARRAHLLPQPQIEITQTSEINKIIGEVNKEAVNFPGPPTLYTERLVLEPITADDLPFIEACYSDWNYVKNLSVEIKTTHSEKNARKKLKNAAAGDLIWILRPKTPEIAQALGALPGEPLGLLDYHKKRTEIRLTDRMFLTVKKFEGRGLMSEALNRANYHIFVTLGQSELFFCNAANNSASHHLKEKTGGRFLGLINRKYNNGATKAETWTLTREDYLQSEAYHKQHALLLQAALDEARQPFLRRIAMGAKHGWLTVLQMPVHLTTRFRHHQPPGNKLA